MGNLESILTWAAVAGVVLCVVTMCFFCGVLLFCLVRQNNAIVGAIKAESDARTRWAMASTSSTTTATGPAEWSPPERDETDISYGRIDYECQFDDDDLDVGRKDEEDEE